MKKLLTIALLLIGTFCYSQARIGHTYSQIKTEFPGGSTSYIDDVKVYCTYKPVGNSAYYFTDNNICLLCVYFPATTEGVNYLIEWNNKNCVTISNNKWKWYTNGAVILIELEYDQGFYFCYRLEV